MISCAKEIMKTVVPKRVSTVVVVVVVVVIIII